jgi:hypothetical protein
MKKRILFFCTAFLALTTIQSCQIALPSQGVVRPVDRAISEWTAVGSVRYEYYSKLGFGVVPYDNLISEAHKQHGKDVDIIEIKEDKIKLDAKTRAQLIKDKPGSYMYKYIYNAIVIKYD